MAFLHLPPVVFCLRRPTFFERPKKVGKEIRSLRRREGLNNVPWQIGTPVVRDPGVQNRFGRYLSGAVSDGVWCVWFRVFLLFIPWPSVIQRCTEVAAVIFASLRLCFAFLFYSNKNLALPF